MEKYFICMLVVMGCMSVHLLIISLSINTIKEYLKAITMQMAQHKADKYNYTKEMEDDGK